LKVIIYTTNCPQCKVLESLLKRSNIEFETCEDVDVMISKGMRSAPNLEVDGTIMNYQQALRWINEVSK
jgi:glutaredoxin